jgi:hypothetical protein
MVNSNSHPSSPNPPTRDEEEVPFDDCLRLLVNTPPKPKKADGKPPPGEEQQESEN